MKYYSVKQHDITDCGAACLATVSKQYGLKLPISKIREIAGTDKEGTSAYGMVKAAEELGFTAKGVKGNQEAFFTDIPLPAIAHVVIDGKLQHYVVIHKITKKQVIIADPSKGIVKYTPEDFFQIWTGILILLVPSTSFEKDDMTKGTLSRFLQLLYPQKSILVNIFLASLLITILGIVASFYFRFILDDVVSNSLRGSLRIISIGVIILYIFKAILEYFRNHLMLYLSLKLDIPLILGYYQHLLSLPMNFFGSRKVGEIISRFMDASKIREAISGATLTIMIDTFMAIFGGIVLYIQNPTLFALTVLIYLVYGIVVFSYNKPIKNINEKIMEENAEVTSYLVESLSGIETIKSYNSERKSQYKTENLFLIFLNSVFKNGALSNGQQTLAGAISSIGQIVILWVGTLNVLNGEMTIGQLITFSVLVGYFSTPIKNLIDLQPTMQTAIVAAERLSEILELSPEKDEQEEKRIKHISLQNPITVSSLNFRYGTRKLVLEGINMTIEPGQKVALIGESGSGKTTLIKLLMRLYDWEQGEIYLGDYNIKDINLKTLRDKIAYISQDTHLFSGTIRENLMLGNENATLEEIVEACKLSRADEFINQMPLRYESMLDENGANLSGGQKQRLAIARALLKKPDILIMDEATSNLDSITEKAIEDTIDNLPGSITLIIIAHRLSTVMNSDKIFVMKDGKIIEEGSHRNLMENQNTYYNLWKEQMPVMPEGGTR